MKAALMGFIFLICEKYGLEMGDVVDILICLSVTIIIIILLYTFVSKLINCFTNVTKNIYNNSTHRAVEQALKDSMPAIQATLVNDILNELYMRGGFAVENREELVKAVMEELNLKGNEEIMKKILLNKSLGKEVGGDLTVLKTKIYLSILNKIKRDD